ncbi:unnamed protein product, partial [Timema podura]|nr:unnamed protein product [Timema podura]
MCPVMAVPLDRGSARNGDGKTNKIETKKTHIGGRTIFPVILVLEWIADDGEIWVRASAVAIHQVIVLRGCLATWTQQYHETTWLKKLEETASNHFKHKMMRTCILDWSKWSDLRAGERILNEQVDTQYRNKLQIRSLQHWKQFVSESCKRKDTLTRVILRHHETVTRRVFLGW